MAYSSNESLPTKHLTIFPSFPIDIFDFLPRKFTACSKAQNRDSHRKAPYPKTLQRYQGASKRFYDDPDHAIRVVIKTTHLPSRSRCRLLAPCTSVLLPHRGGAVPSPMGMGRNGRTDLPRGSTKRSPPLPWTVFSLGCPLTGHNWEAPLLIDQTPL